MAQEKNLPQPGAVVVQEGAFYYAGGTVPKKAERPIILGSPFTDADGCCPDQPANSLAQNFSQQPPRTGGVANFVNA